MSYLICVLAPLKASLIAMPTPPVRFGEIFCACPFMNIAVFGKKWRRNVNGKNTDLFIEKHAFSLAEKVHGEFLKTMKNDRLVSKPDDRFSLFFY